MRTFCITTLGCKVNQYESEQIAGLLCGRGLVRVDGPETADLRIINTCSVTIQAASKSRQTVRQHVSSTVSSPVTLPVLESDSSITGAHLPQFASAQRVIVTGCWATSDRMAASKLPGVSAVLTHHDDVAAELDRLISQWQSEDQQPPAEADQPNTCESRPEPLGDDGWMIQASALDNRFAIDNKSQAGTSVKEKTAENPTTFGTTHLPLLSGHQHTQQRGFLKIQDGCDAHCTYCIIPRLRPRLWSKPVEDVVSEARALVAAGHVELVLTGIFLSAYGQETALRRRQIENRKSKIENPLANLIEALCGNVPGLRRLRLSSLEPGDLSPELIGVLRSHPQVVPHFHLPLQSGSAGILRRMNRQYTRDDYLRMIDQVKSSFDRPALTTDIIVGFPGETDAEFEQTLDVVDRAGFIHIHAFSFSPRPGTAAARWTSDFIHGPVVNERLNFLKQRAADHSLIYRQQFQGETVELIVERPGRDEMAATETAPPIENRKPKTENPMRHGRCERYFPVHFESPSVSTGDCVQVRIDRITPTRTHGTPRDASIENRKSKIENLSS